MKAAFQIFFSKRRYRFGLGLVLLFSLEFKKKVCYSVVSFYLYFFFLFFSSSAFLPLVFPLSSLKKNKLK